MIYWISTIILFLITYVIIKALGIKNRFKQHGIPNPTKIPYIDVIVNMVSGKHNNTSMKELYNLHKEAKYLGLHDLNTEMILVRDLDLIKSILVKNFDHFSHIKQFVDEDIDPLFGKNLAFASGERWRELRNLLSPAFTSNKMRSMFGLISQCGKNFVEQLVDRYQDEDAVELKDAVAKYATDVIATCAYGIEVDSMKDPHNDFYNFGKNSSIVSLSIIIKVLTVMVLPKCLARLLGIRLVSRKDTDFIVNVVKSTIETRKQKGIVRPDMLQLMMDAQGKTENLSILEMSAQAYIFFLAGFDTTSAHMTMIAHELAVNPEIQQKLHEEIDTAFENNDGQLTYEIINNMKLLDAVFSETLRLHPIGTIFRLCSKEFELPPTLPESKPYVVRKGVEIMIPVAGIHADPDYYHEPEKFNPDRFFNKKSTMSDIVNMGFGIGPRTCIGNRFAILEIKVLFVYLLRKVSLMPCEKTRLPLEYETYSFSPTPKGGCWLKLKLRNDKCKDS